MPEAKPDEASPGDPRVYFAAERTLLAWVRTGLAMMGFGFVVAKFGLFLRELAIAQGMPAPQQTGVSAWFGTSLIGFGADLMVWSAANHWLTVRRLEQERPLRFHRLSAGVFVALILATISLLVAAILVFQTSTC